MTKKCHICHHQIRFFQAQNPFSAPAEGAYDVPPDPIVGWGEGYSLPNPLSARRLWRRELGAAYGASVLRPPSTQNPGYASVLRKTMHCSYE